MVKGFIKSFTYNNIQKPEWLILNKVNRPMFTSVTPRTLEVQGRRGSYLFGTRKESKEISIDITIMADNDNDLWLKVEWLAGWLDQGKELPLLFNDEPERTYMAVFTPGSGDMDQLAQMGSGQLTFFCPDPLKYGLHYNYSVGNAANLITLTNRGNADMHPLYTINFTKQQNYFALLSPDGFIQYGNPAAIEQTPVLPLERVFYDQMNDLAPWTASGITLDYGEAAGTMRVDSGHRFQVADWGDSDDNAAAWHGPVLKRSLPQPLQDFRATFFIELYSDRLAMGRVELWFLSTTGAIVARMLLWDRYPGGEMNTGHIVAGPVYDTTDIVRSPGPVEHMWDDFIGRLTLRREGNDWRASITKTDAQMRDIAKTQVYNRVIHNGDLDQISQVQIAIRKYGKTPAPSASIREVIIEKINQVNVAADETPALFQPGDRLEIDTNTGAGWLNGQYFNEFLDPGSRFFPIVPGITDLKALTTDPTGVSISVDYTERFK